MSSQKKYIFCVVESRPEIFEKLKEGRNDISFISFRELTAVVKEGDSMDYLKLPREILLKHLNCYQLFVENIMQQLLPLPVKFGTCVESMPEVTDILERGYHFFKDMMRSMSGKIEIEVIATYRAMEAVFREIGEDKRIRELKEKIGIRPGRFTQSDKITLGQLVNTLLIEKKTGLSGEINSCLKEIALDSCPHSTLNDQMITNCAFLLLKEDEDRFLRAVSELNNLYEDKIDFKCVGPLPMYSFYTVELNNVDVDCIEKSRKSLELDEIVSLNKVKENYRRLAEKYHPDKDDGTSASFEEISKAYEILSDYCQNYNIPMSPENLIKEKHFRKLKVEV